MNTFNVVILVLLSLWAGIGINTMLVTTGVVSGICTMEDPSAPPAPKRR